MRTGLAWQLKLDSNKDMIRTQKKIWPQSTDTANTTEISFSVFKVAFQTVIPDLNISNLISASLVEDVEHIPGLILGVCSHFPFLHCLRMDFYFNQSKSKSSAVSNHT